MKDRKNYLIYFVVWTLMVTCTVPLIRSTAENRTIYVDDDNTEGPWLGTPDDPYRYIQDGINEASNGDTVYVYSGSYRIQTGSPLYIYNSINLVGQNKETTTIWLDRMNANIVISAYDVEFKGFTIKASGGPANFLKITGNGALIEDNIFGDPSHSMYGGGRVIIDGYSDQTVLKDNIIYGSTYCIEMYHPGNGNKIISNNLIGLDHTSYGIIFNERGSGNFDIYLNNFYGPFLDGCVTIMSQDIHNWDDGLNGNYWYDYEERYPDANKVNYKWDIPYEINENNKDTKPCVNPDCKSKSSTEIIQDSSENDEGVIDQYQLNYSESNYLLINAESPIAQSFIPTQTTQIKIGFVLKKPLAASKPLKISIKESLEDEALSHVEITPNELPLFHSWVTVDIPNTHVSDETYFIVFESECSLFNSYSIYGIWNDVINHYDRGEIWCYDETGNWLDYGHYSGAIYPDLAFKTYASGTNRPPTSPLISGTKMGLAHHEYTYSFSSTDPDNHDVYYLISWGDGTNSGWLGPYDSGEKITRSHVWSQYEDYVISAVAKDIMDESGPLNNYSISMKGEPPSKPIIAGPASGNPRTNYEYSFTSTDPYDGNITYYITWGDGSLDEYDSCKSGEVCYSTHKWKNNGRYEIKAKAQGLHGAESTESILEVTMPKNNQMINQFLNLMKNHTNLFSIFQWLLRFQ